LVINPHKMLFVPFDFSALYLRDIGRLRRLFTLVPEYLHLRDPVGAEINYMDYGVQLGRRFRALKAWVVWRAFGREGIAARIRDHLRLAKLFAEWVRNDKRFELAAPVSMGVVCFRLVTGDPDTIDNRNATTVERINASGSVYITQKNCAAAPLCELVSATCSRPSSIFATCGNLSRRRRAIWRDALHLVPDIWDDTEVVPPLQKIVGG